MAYAVIKTGGKQYRVKEGDIIEVEKLGSEKGSKISFSDSTFLADGADIKTSGITVSAEVIAQKKGEKVIAYKYRRRKGYHRTVGHRQQLTALRITGVK